MSHETGTTLAQQKPVQTLPACVLIATGGTIASRIDPQTGLAMPAWSGEDLLATVPAIRELATIEVENFLRVPSPHIGPDDWVRLHQRVVAALERPEVAGVVISHGTALLEETAWFLDLTISHEKPVVLIGAQRNASEPDFDGPRNLLNAVRVCVAPRARGNGVLAVLNHHINAAREVTKTHSFDVETFNSGEWGYLGNVAPEGVIFHRTPRRRQHVPLSRAALPTVEIIPMYAGASGALVHAAAAYAQGIVIQAVGAGHVNPAMYEAIREAIRAGIRVVITTRIPRGGARACYGFAGASQLLKDAGAILGSDLSACKARILLMLALQNKCSAAQTEELFDV
jgi:L-asparaginase